MESKVLMQDREEMVEIIEEDDADANEEKHAKVEHGVKNNDIESIPLMNFMLLFYKMVLENRSSRCSC